MASGLTPALASASRMTRTSTRVRLLGRASASQHHGVAGAQRERGDVDGHVRPRLVDGADHAERHAHLLEGDAVRHPVTADDLADGIGERGDLPHGVGERRDALLIEAKPIEEGVADAVGAPAIDVASRSRR